MDIATDTVVRLGFQQGFRLFLHMSAIHPGQRGDEIGSYRNGVPCRSGCLCG